MNSTLEILTPPTEIHEPAPATAPGSESQAESSAPTGTPHSEHRGRGKIACLPKKVRDHLNQMLEDGVRYAQIKENLGEHGKDLTPDNISQWKKRGHQAWLKEQFWREEMRARMDAFTDLLGDTDPAQLPMVGLQMSLTQLCEQLRDIGPGARKDQFEADADKYLRMLNTISRLSKSMLAIQKFQRDPATANAVELKRLDLNRKMNEAEETAMQDKSDDFFGWKSADRIRREMANADLNLNPVRTDSTPSLVTAPKSDEGGSASASSSPQPEGLKEGSRGSPSAKTPGTVPARPQHPEGMPESLPAGPPDHNSRSEHPLSGNKLVAGFGSQSSILNPESGATNPGIQQSTNPEVHRGLYSIQNPPSPRFNIPSFHHSITPVPSERCHECGTLLPPLLSSGERPTPHCKKCGTALRAPGALIEFCPKCRHVLQELNANGTRPTPNCQYCNKPLPCPP